ncbi:MAG: dephospho-CoA kinase, partial [Arenicellales bacterium]
MLRIALTGGIGSGKTAVTQHLSALGVPVLDADDFSHQATRPGEPAVAQIAKVFGPGVLSASGNLDRAALGQMVFADKGKRKQLEAILHPEIRKRMNEVANTLD